MMRLVLATNNQGKLRELQALLAPLHFEVLPKSLFTQDEVDETGSTFVANALIKARHAAGCAQLPAIADDSGIAVDALGGAPGVWSARYAGVGASDEANLQKLLAALQSVPDEQRQARYHCALVFVRTADDPEPIICEATWSGVIGRAPVGSGGFGYDPIFWLPELGLSAAQITAELKNRVSHRAQALQCLLQRLRAARE